MYAFYFHIFRTWRLPSENKMRIKHSKKGRETAAVGGCAKISVYERSEVTRIRKLSAYEIFWIYSSSLHLLMMELYIRNVWVTKELVDLDLTLSF